MATVIFINCKLRYNVSPEDGKEFYRHIFTQQKYKKYKSEVDDKLINAGYADCIVDVEWGVYLNGYINFKQRRYNKLFGHVHS